MPKLFSTFPLVFLLSMTTALSAQDATVNQEGTSQDQQTMTSDAETATSGSDDTDALDMGQDVQADGTYIKEQHGDWQMKCFRSPDGNDPCQMYQLLFEDAGNPVAEVSLFRLPEGRPAVAGATIVVPLGTLLPEELQISVDGGRAKSYGFRFCSMVGCFAQIGLTQDEINAFKAGTTATLQIVPAQAPDQIVEIKASLSGFTAAYENISVAQN